MKIGDYVRVYLNKNPTLEYIGCIFMMRTSSIQIRSVNGEKIVLYLDTDDITILSDEEAMLWKLEQ